MSCKRGHVVFTVKLCFGIMQDGSGPEKLNHIEEAMRKTRAEIWRQYILEGLRDVSVEELDERRI